MSAAGTPWGDLTAAERLDLLVTAIEPLDRKLRVQMALADHFGPDGPGDFTEAVNVMLREAWRDEHGEVERWDKAADAAPVPIVTGLVRWEGRVTRGGDGERHVAVEWPRRNGTPRVLVDGRKVNAKQRRRWLAWLAAAGVTRERTRTAVKAPGDLRVAYSDDGS